MQPRKRKVQNDGCTHGGFERGAGERTRRINGDARRRRGKGRRREEGEMENKKPRASCVRIQHREDDAYESAAPF